MSSLISLILITKLEKHDCLRYRELQLKEKERKTSAISKIPNAKLSPCDIDDIDEQKTYLLFISLSVKKHQDKTTVLGAE